jgi:Spy/CpxP family protein refolding chaperone
MRRQCLAGLMILISLAMVSLALGQGEPTGKWWRDPGIVQELKLSDQDVNRLEKLFSDSRRLLIDLTKDVEKAQFDYQQAVEADPLDEKKVNRRFQDLEQARSRLASEQSRFSVGVRKILGHDRFQRLKQIYSRRQ